MFRFMRHAAAAAAIGATLTFGGSAAADTFNITMVSGHGTHLPWIRLIGEFYIPEVNKRLKDAGGKHSINWQEAYGGTVVKLGGEMQAVREGVAEMAHVYTIFEPANLPLLQVTHMTPFSADNVERLSQIMVELNAQMKELKDHWARQNQVFLGSVVADSVHIFTKKPFSTIDELRGMKIGAAGSTALWANGIGMVPVDGDFSTHYNNLRTGVYDSLFSFITGAFPIKVFEVAPYLTKIDIGATSIGAITINKKLYDSMPADVQKILHDVGVEYSKRVASILAKLAADFEAKMASAGTKIADFPKEQRAKWANTMPNIAQDWVKRNEERGLPANLVLKSYLDKLRGTGQTLLRDWDKS